VVAHGLGVINVLANTALHLIDQQPQRARSTLTVINDVSGQALVGLRSVLGVLRQVGEELPRSPAPTQLLVIAILGGAAGVIAAIHPARRALRLPVLRAIAAE
jgi:ABC-type lipoprotein release transport system permease subunit